MTTPADDLRAAHALEVLRAWGKERAKMLANLWAHPWEHAAYDAARALADSLASATDTTSGTGRPNDATIAALAAVPPMTPEIAAELIAQGKAAAAEVHVRYAEMKRAAWRETSGTGRGEG